MPVEDEGKALCNEEYYKNIAKSENVKWAKFAKEDELGLAGKNKSLRNVHAKVYRFYSKDIEEEIIFVGSVNFSKQAFGLAGRKKNMEAGFIKYCDPPSYKPLLKPVKDEVEFSKDFDDEEPGTEDEKKKAPLFSLRYDWKKNELQYFLIFEEDMNFSIKGIGDFIVKDYKHKKENSGKWVRIDLSDEFTSRIEKILYNSSFLQIYIEEYNPFYVIVQETGMSQKPSLINDLTPKQIIELWSILDPEEKIKYLGYIAASRFKSLLGEFGEEVALTETGSFFSEFSQIFQAFKRFKGHLNQDIEEENLKVFEY